MSEIGDIVREQIDRWITPHNCYWGEPVSSCRCGGVGIAEKPETIQHVAECWISRAQAALAAHEAEHEALVAIKDAAERLCKLTRSAPPTEYEKKIWATYSRLDAAVADYQAATK